MRKMILCLSAVFLLCSLSAQDIQHEAVAINIEVPVRVFKGDTFVPNLTIEDFEVYEDGTLQKVEAVYLIKKTDIKREDALMGQDEARKKFAPEASRYFVLIFIITEYMPKIEEAVDYFFEKVYQQGDSLSFATALKTYNLKKEYLASVPKDEISRQMKERIRIDTMRGNAEYIALIQEILECVRDNDYVAYEGAMTRLTNLRHVDQNQMEAFANFLKRQNGQKYAFMFYQQEVLPQMQASTFSGDMHADEMARNLGVPAEAVPDFSLKDVYFNQEFVARTFADSSISLNFIYITKDFNDPLDVRNGVSITSTQFIDMSQNIFQAFEMMARATGGFSTSGQNIAQATQKAVESAENYYLLYYSPKDYRADGKFRKIKVKVKNSSYRVSHRMGYFGN